MIRKGVQYLLADGTLTTAGVLALGGLETRLAALEVRLNAAAAVADAAGGATVDAEARAELVAIKAALS